MHAPQPLDLATLRSLQEAGGCAILDARPRALAQTGHLPGAAWLPVSDPQQPAPDLPAGMLPPRGEPLVVVAADPASARAIAVHLCARGYPTHFFDGALPAEGLRAGLPDGALWRPDPWLVATAALLPHTASGAIADLGGGSGRDAVWLAQRGFRVLVVDRLPDALALAKDRAERHGVRIETLAADLRWPDRVAAHGPFAAVLLLRFLIEPVLQALPALLMPSGIVVLHALPQRPHGLPTRALQARFGASPWELLRPPTEETHAGRRWVGLVARARG